MGSDILNMSWVNSKALLAGGEVDFFIRGYTDKKFMFLGHEVYLTTTHISMIIVMAFLLVFALFANHAIKKADPKEAPGPFLNVVELIVEKLDGMVASSMGARNAVKFRNYVSALFLFILTCNLSGLLGLRPPTADYGVTLPLGLITFALVQGCGIAKNKGKHFTNLFKPVPILFPINLIGEFAVPLSLSLRLFGNIMSGTVMMGLIYGLLPIFLKLGIPAALHVYFDPFSGAIQTYVFCMLTMVYINDKIADE